jgi:BASS family bile acid:Na+ symporter
VTIEQWIGVLNVTALAAIMLSMGLQVRVQDVWAAARPVRLVALCLFANYVLVPIAVLALLTLFQAIPLVSIGFLILAICPGAPIGPPMCAIAKGNLPLAVSMMVMLAGLSPILTPALLALLAPRVAPHADIQINLLLIGRTLVIAQLAPLALGLAVHSRWPNWSARVESHLRKVANVLLVTLIGLIIVSQYQMLVELKVKAWFGMTLLLVASLAIGWLSGGPTLGDRKTIALTTANRNLAVALVIVTSSFADTPAVLAVVAYGLFGIVGSLVIAVMLRRSSI